MESTATPGLAWKWILEKLLDLPDFGMDLLNDVITMHVSDVQEPHCRALLERVALRNLEEIVLANQIDACAISPLKTLIGEDTGSGATTGSSFKQRFNRELVLRLQTEVVLSTLRKDATEGEIDWAKYAVQLEEVFLDAEDNNRLLDRKRELSALLMPKNQTKTTVASYFEKYALKKLRDDLSSFIEEKRMSFKILFLDQLSRDFLDADGKPFAEGVEKSTTAEANGKQDNGGQTPKLNETVDQHTVLGSAMISGRKRLRRMLLPTQHDESDEAEEGSAGMKKPRNVPLPSVVEPLSHQGVMELAVPASGRRSGCSSLKQDVESCRQLSLLKRDEEPLSGLGNLMMRSSSSVAHESNSKKVTKISPTDPSSSKKYVVISDVDSDAETQVIETLSTDSEDAVTVEGDRNKLNKKGSQSLRENGSGQKHHQTIVEAEVVREETTIVPMEKTLGDRNEVSRGSPKVKESPYEDYEKFVTKKDFIPLDSQDTSEVGFLHVGSDGHEDFCHTCGKAGKLRCCNGCPISMHFDCIEGLELRLPEHEADWYCPVCISRRAAREAAETEKAAEVAKEKLLAFKEKAYCFPGGNNSSAEKGMKQSRLKASSLESGENDRSLMSKQLSDDELKQGRRDAGTLASTVLGIGLNELKQRNLDRSPHADKPQSSRLACSGGGADGNNVGRSPPVNEQPMFTSPISLEKSGACILRDVSGNPHETQFPHHQEVSRKDRFTASTSGQVKRKRERCTGFTKEKDTGVHSDEESEEQAGPVVPEPKSGTGDHEVIKADKENEVLHEDRSEDGIQGALFCGRRRVPGLRRKPLPWTRQEELALKEGVKRYSHNGSWGFQWKRILEFGQGKFDPTRTDVDLKDKWRNLVKGVS